MGRIISWVRAKLQGIRLIQILKVLKMNSKKTYRLKINLKFYQMIQIK